MAGYAWLNLSARSLFLQPLHGSVAVPAGRRPGLLVGVVLVHYMACIRIPCCALQLILFLNAFLCACNRKQRLCALQCVSPYSVVSVPQCAELVCIARGCCVSISILDAHCCLLAAPGGLRSRV